MNESLPVMLQEMSKTEAIQQASEQYSGAMAAGFDAGVNHFFYVLIVLATSYMFELGLWAMQEYFGWGERADRIRSRWHTRLVTFRFVVLLALVTKTYFIRMTVLMI